MQTQNCSHGAPWFRCTSLFIWDGLNKRNWWPKKNLVVLICLSVSVIKRLWTKTTWEGKSLFHLTGYSPSSRKAKAGAQSRDRGWALFTGLLPNSCLTTFLTQCTGVVAPTLSWAFLNQLAVKKKPHKHAHRSICWTQFFWGFSLLVCQVYPSH